MQPTIGRMVYYKARGSADGVFDRAAVVTETRVATHEFGVELEKPSYEVRLAVLNPDGLFFSEWLVQGQEDGQWDWMPFQKDQQARLGLTESKAE